MVTRKKSENEDHLKIHEQDVAEPMLQRLATLGA